MAVQTKLRSLLICASWLVTGIVAGSYLFSGTSAVSLLRLFVLDQGRADQINVPSVWPKLFRVPTLYVRYPGGAVIIATQPKPTGQVSDLLLLFNSDMTSFQVSCGYGRKRIDFGINVEASPIEQKKLIRMSDGRGLDERVEARLLADYYPSRTVPEQGHRRAMLVEGEEAQHMLSILAKTPFPARLDLLIADDTQSEPRSTIRVWTVGTVQPVAESTYTAELIPEPPSNPFKVMDSFCAKAS